MAHNVNCKRHSSKSAPQWNPVAGSASSALLGNNRTLFETLTQSTNKKPGCGSHYSQGGHNLNPRTCCSVGCRCVDVDQLHESPSPMWSPHLSTCVCVFILTSGLYHHCTHSPIVLTAEPPLPQLAHTEQLDSGGNLNFYANGFM